MCDKQELAGALILERMSFLARAILQSHVQTIFEMKWNARSEQVHIGGRSGCYTRLTI